MNLSSLYKNYFLSKNLNVKTSRLKDVIFTYETFRKHVLRVNFVSTSSNNKCVDCEILEKELEDMHEILRKFTRGTNYLNMIFGNQRWMYIKDCQPKNNAKYFSKFFHANKNSKHRLFKCTYCDKYGHIISWRKIMNQIRNELLK